jgi:hypothetical protein
MSDVVGKTLRPGKKRSLSACVADHATAPNKLSEVTPGKNQRDYRSCRHDVEQFNRTIATIGRNAEPPFDEIHSDSPARVSRL